MNNLLKESAKKILKGLLSNCNKDQQLIFKRIYCSGNLYLSIDESVDNMDENKIDNAISQCERTIEKNNLLVQGLELDNSNDKYLSVKDMIELIKNPNRNWIDVNRKLPAEGYSVLVTDGKDYEVFWYILSGEYVWRNQYCPLDYDHPIPPIQFNPTHWMPLPNLPDGSYQYNLV